MRSFKGMVAMVAIAVAGSVSTSRANLVAPLPLGKPDVGGMILSSTISPPNFNFGGMTVGASLPNGSSLSTGTGAASGLFSLVVNGPTDTLDVSFNHENWFHSTHLVDLGNSGTTYLFEFTQDTGGTLGVDAPAIGSLIGVDVNMSTGQFDVASIATPLPATAVGGLALLGVVGGVAAIRRRRIQSA